MKWLWWLLIWGSGSALHAQNKLRHSVLIHEFLPDPTPPRGLPNAEFIELKNVSHASVQLRNWRISNGSTSGKIITDFLLKPDSMVILVSSGALASYRSFGTCISLTPFPALNNEEDTLLLFNEKDSLIHAVAYHTSWYRNPVKKEGGWSLEMIDDSQPCLQSMNWIASTSVTGGTPGQPNQTAGSIKDSSAPWIAHAYLADSLTIYLHMSEPMYDTMVSFTPQIDVISQRWLPPLFQVLQVVLRQPFPKDSLLTLWMKAAADCSGNRTTSLSTTIGRFATQINTQCIINEILFDPPAGGSDYVEIYNRSPQPIDIAQLMLANRSASGVISSYRSITSSPLPLLPNHYLVLTEDSSWVNNYYSPGQVFILVTAMPAFPDDEGTVVLLNMQGSVVDELHYTAKWHHPLMSSTQGVSLERINPMGNTQQQQNWHSAASTTRFGSPGYRNSQSVPDPDPGDAILTPSSLVISPDQDGFQDILRLLYVLDQPGYLANIDVYSSWGFPVQTIASNQLCGTKGEFVWNGLSMQQQPLKKGTYIIHARFHLPNGKLRQQKIAIGVW